jgi:cell division protease FtsH
MITQYGMSKKFGLIGLESVQHRYLDGRAVLQCGEATAAEIDQEVMEILKQSYEEAKRLLLENREALDQIADFLIEKETITGKEFMKIFRKVKGIESDEEETTSSGESTEGESAEAGCESIEEVSSTTSEDAVSTDTSSEESGHDGI